MTGRIISNISDLYKVKSENNYVMCKAKGNFKNKKLKPLVGDEVLFDYDKKLIIELLPRKNILQRPPICNVDLALIVISAKEPEFDSYLLDKMISIITFNHINIVICFTKLDLLSEEELVIINNYMAYYKKIGYTVVTNNDIEPLKNFFKNKIIVVTGQSGVGKSSLLNRLDSSLNLKTNIISHALGRGKHTTRHVELLEIEDYYIADTPGFSALDFYDMEKEDIRNSFVEFSKYMDECRYRDCFHLKEDNCKIKSLVSDGLITLSRYKNYQKFIEEKEEIYGKNIGFHSVRK